METEEDLESFAMNETSASEFSDQSSEGIGPDIPNIEWENLDELYEMAEDYVRATKIGEFQRYQWPFELQTSGDFHILYKRLNPLFDAADKARRGVRSLASVMRLTTLAAFIMYLVLLWFMLDVISISDGGNTINLEQVFLDGNWKWLVGMAFTAAIARGARSMMLSGLGHSAAKFGASFNTNLHVIQSKANFALDNISKHGATTEGCGDRAERWAFISLWLFQLHQIYDRYVTTASWRGKSSLFFVSLIFRMIKAAFVLLFFCFLIQHAAWFFHDLLPSALVFLLVAILPGFVWDTGLRQGASNDLWADNFIPSISGRSEEEIFKNHMNIKISKVVGEIRDLQFQTANA